MPRAARVLSKIGTYHIMLKGINLQNIFVDDEDNECFLDTLARYQEKTGKDKTNKTLWFSSILFSKRTLFCLSSLNPSLITY